MRVWQIAGWIKLDLWGPLLPSVTTRLITSVVNAFPSFVKRYLNNSNTAVVQLKLLSASQPSSMRSMKLVNLRRPASSTFFFFVCEWQAWEGRSPSCLSLFSLLNTIITKKNVHTRVSIAMREVQTKHISWTFIVEDWSQSVCGSRYTWGSVAHVLPESYWWHRIQLCQSI